MTHRLELTMSAPGRLSTPGIGASSATDWLTLLKPRVILLVVFTGAVGMIVAPGHMHPVLAFTAVLCIAVAAGAAGAINMWYDRDIDAVMRRTSARPIPAGRIAPGEALGFGVTLACGSVLLMALAANLAAATALAVSIAFYVFVYTIWLKRRTPQNIVIGGAAGAFPPVIGWMAVTGDVGWLPVIMFIIIFAWTPPHFWALSLYAQGDYRRAGIPMLPVVAGARATRRHVFGYSVLMVSTTTLPLVLGMVGWMYASAMCGLGGWFLLWAWRVWRDKQDEKGVSLTKDAPAKRLFRVSLLYLALLFAALAVDHLVG